MAIDNLKKTYQSLRISYDLFYGIVSINILNILNLFFINLS